jgi:DNA modification methylase
MRVIEKLEWGKLATFIPNKKLPVYNWFYFKEGFARNLVMFLLDRYASEGSVNVLDPFVGSGTTLVACRERGLDSYGFDALPLAVLASRTKAHQYDRGELKKAIKELSKTRFQRQDVKAVPKDIRRFFNPHTLEDVLFFREQIERYKDETGDFLKLGLITSTTRCSWIYKDGAVLKVRKKPVPVFRKFYIRTLRNMLKDLQKVEFRPSQTFVDEGDARNLKIDSEFIDLVITSPPYLNKIEYTNIYRIEESLFFGEQARPGLRSYIGLDKEAETAFPELDLPPAANAYFSDMKSVLGELYRVCKPGAVLAFVIGDGCFPDGVVHCDELLPKLAEEQGFSTERVYVLNRRTCTRKRVIKVGKMEESLIIFKK